MDFETYITGISLALFIISLFLLAKYLDLNNNMKELIKNSSELHDLTSVEIKVKELEEEVFCLKHDIKFDSASHEMSYNLVNSFLNYAYHIEIQYYINFSGWSIESFYSDMISAKIMVDGEVVKEIEVNRQFYSVSEIYDYLGAKIKDYDYDVFLLKQLAKIV
ncbi:hypothetical protein [Lactococcus petauri]|uniref:hypothetical protein n=1 Tax=Lactococcus petauri TaxID=1940789 RepID=UPI00254A5FB2|nr:hypothetical protein [Lactococcus petauri]